VKQALVDFRADIIMEMTQASFDKLIDWFTVFLPKLFLAIVVFALAVYAAKLTARLVKRALELRKTDPELVLLLSRVSQWMIIIFGLIVALQQVDFNVSSFVAGLGIVGFTLGFAFQDIAKNFMSGVMLLIQQPFDIGDAIEVNGFGGSVTQIEIRSTTLLTWDGKHVVIPNIEVYTSSITNYSRSPKRRLKLELGVAYDSVLEQVTTVIKEAFKRIEGVVQDDPAPEVVFESFGESSIKLTVYYWVDTTKNGYWEVQDRSLKMTKVALEKAGIRIPFPTRTVLMDK
jgi:small conductance mechanosensitive channel